MPGGIFRLDPRPQQGARSVPLLAQPPADQPPVVGTRAVVLAAVLVGAWLAARPPMPPPEPGVAPLTLAYGDAPPLTSVSTQTLASIRRAWDVPAVIPQLGEEAASWNTIVTADNPPPLSRATLAIVRRSWDLAFVPQLLEDVAAWNVPPSADNPPPLSWSTFVTVRRAWDPPFVAPQETEWCAGWNTPAPVDAPPPTAVSRFAAVVAAARREPTQARRTILPIAPLASSEVLARLIGPTYAVTVIEFVSTSSVAVVDLATNAAVPVVALDTNSAVPVVALDTNSAVVPWQIP